MSLIGVAGQFRNGKDEIANYLAKRLNLKRVAFASNVKRIFCETFDVDLDFVETWKTKSEAPPGFNISVRQSLQFIGDGFRKIKNDIWVDLIFRNNFENIVISDVRYINELIKIKKNNGINILVYRPGYLNNDPNESETQIKTFVEYFIKKGLEGKVSEKDEKFKLIDYFIINDKNIKDLYEKINFYFNL